MSEPRNCFSVSEIIDNAERFIIPDIQRSLVWKPSQIELLWDSLLRGFSIGGLITAYSDGNYDILDGQQRLAALKLIKENSRTAKLWLDLGYKRDFARSSRKFGVMLTTISAPWGFRISDNNERLSTVEKENALKDTPLKMLGWESFYDIYNQHVDIEKTWPYQAVLPIPLSKLYDFYKRNGSFESFIEEEIKEEDKVKMTLTAKELDSAFKQALAQIVPFNICNIDNDDMYDLEIFFSRIAKGGTPATNADIAYSTLKHRFKGISKSTREMSEIIQIPENKIGLVAMKTAISMKEQKYINMLTQEKIRASEFEEHDELNPSNLIGYFEKIKTVLCWNKNMVDGESRLSPYFFEKLFDNHEALLSVLLLLVKQEEEQLKSNREKLRRTVLLFLLQEKSYPLNRSQMFAGKFYRKYYAIGKDVFFLIDQCILELVSEDCFIPLYETCKKDRWNSAIWLETCWENLLLQAEDDFLYSCFKDYTRYAFEDENKPWDYDHIVPQEWTYNKKKGEYRHKASELTKRLGNIAAIPFSENRSKRNYGIFKYYGTKKNKEKLLFETDFQSLTPEGILNRKNEIKKFETAVRNREKNIYEKVAKDISIVFLDGALPDKIKKRNILLGELVEDSLNYYIIESCENAWDKDVNLGKRLESTYDKARKWVGIGKSLASDDRFIAMVLPDTENEIIEVGIRIGNGRFKSNNEVDQLKKKMQERSNDENLLDNDFWICEKKLKKDSNKDTIMKTFEKFIDMFNTIRN